MLQTERLIIRRFTKEDWQDLYEYLRDEEVVQFEPYEVYTEEQAKQETLKRVNDDCFFAVCLKADGTVIGNLTLIEGAFQTWEVGFVFNRQYQRKGYATESVKALMNYAFTHLGARRIVAMCSPLNEPSWKLLERIGMRYERTLLQNVYFKKDEEGKPIWLDTYEYAILKSEWIKQG